MSLYLGDERIVEVKTVVNADKIVFEYTYNAETNPAATVQSVEERVKDFVPTDTYTADKAAINNSITQAETRVTKELDAYAETTNATLGTMEVNINKLAWAIDGLSKTKQDNLTFDGTYNASTNPVATVETVANEVAKIVANAPEDLDTLEEIAAWIKANPGSAAGLNELVNKNKQDIATLQSTKQDKLTFDGTYSASTNPVATVETVNALKTKVENGDIVPAVAKTIATDGSITVSLDPTGTAELTLETGLYAVVLKYAPDFGDTIYCSSGLLNVAYIDESNSKLSGSVMLSSGKNVLRLSVEGTIESANLTLKKLSTVSSWATIMIDYLCECTLLKIGEGIGSY